MGGEPRGQAATMRLMEDLEEMTAAAECDPSPATCSKASLSHSCLSGFLGLKQSRQQGRALSSALGNGLLSAVDLVVCPDLPKQVDFICWSYSWPHPTISLAHPLGMTGK